MDEDQDTQADSSTVWTNDAAPGASYPQPPPSLTNPSPPYWQTPEYLFGDPGYKTTQPPPDYSGIFGGYTDPPGVDPSQLAPSGPAGPRTEPLPGGEIPTVAPPSSKPGFPSRAKDFLTGETPFGGDWKGGVPLGTGPNESHDDPQMRDRVDRDSADKSDAARKGVGWPQLPISF